MIRWIRVLLSRAMSFRSATSCSSAPARYANHVGMYIGDGNFVHASTPSTGVRINCLNETYYTNRYIGARRIITG